MTNAFGIIHWADRKAVASKAYLYSDATTYEVPVTLTHRGGDGSGDTEKRLASAVYMSGHRGPIVGSSYGACSRRLVDFCVKDGRWVATIEESFGIGE